MCQRQKITIINLLRSWLLKIWLICKGAHIGSGFAVLGAIDIVLKDNASFSNLYIGDNVVFGGKTTIRMRKSGKIIIGNNVQSGAEVGFVTASESNLIIGRNTLLGSYCIFNGSYGISIGNDCLFASFVYINSTVHSFQRSELIRKQRLSGAPVVIGNDVFVGGHVFINKGVCINNGAVVGAGSVVTKDVPTYSIVAGNPARPIKERE